MKPIEIALKTAKTERNIHGKLDTRSLPFGLKILVPCSKKG